MRIASFAVCLLMIATPFAAADAAAVSGGDSNCNNNGIVVQVSATGDNSYECTTYTQYCDQGTGAGSGAGAGGPGQNDVGAEAGASANCEQASDDPKDDEQCVRTQTTDECTSSATAVVADVQSAIQG